jgi:hypothetical protein
MLKKRFAIKVIGESVELYRILSSSAASKRRFDQALTLPGSTSAAHAETAPGAGGEGADGAASACAAAQAPPAVECATDKYKCIRYVHQEQAFDIISEAHERLAHPQKAQTNFVEVCVKVCVARTTSAQCKLPHPWHENRATTCPSYAHGSCAIGLLRTQRFLSL